jgi:hypothetical protein
MRKSVKFCIRQHSFKIKNHFYVAKKNYKEELKVHQNKVENKEK